MIDNNEVHAFAATIRACENPRFGMLTLIDGEVIDDLESLIYAEDGESIELVNEPIANFIEHQGAPTHSWTHNGVTVNAWLSSRRFRRAAELRIAEFGDHCIVHQERL